MTTPLPSSPCGSISSSSAQSSNVGQALLLDLSYQQLSSVQSNNDSLDNGSAVTADSFVGYNIHSRDDDDSDFSYDPYLDNARRRMKSRLGQEEKDQPTTPATISLDEDDDSILEQQAIMASPFRGLPKVLEIPIKLFEAPCETIEFEPQESEETTDPAKRKSIHERNFWNSIVTQRVKNHGTIHVKVAEGLLLLGNAHMNCLEYSEALAVYKSALRIYEKVYGSRHLSVARLLDKVGVAASSQEPSKYHNEVLLHDAAYRALHKAFCMRFEQLGPLHIDTVDSLNNLAAVQVIMQDYGAACTSYHEVLVARQLIFGPTHPSVAISAQKLGNVMVKLSQLDNAALYYRRAMSIYRQMKLKPSNPTMKRMLRDVAQLERVSTGVEGCKSI